MLFGNFETEEINPKRYQDPILFRFVEYSDIDIKKLAANAVSESEKKSENTNERVSGKKSAEFSRFDLRNVARVY